MSMQEFLSTILITLVVAITSDTICKLILITLSINRGLKPMMKDILNFFFVMVLFMTITVAISELARVYDWPIDPVTVPVISVVLMVIAHNVYNYYRTK